MLLWNKRWQSLRRAWAQRLNLEPTQTGHDVGAGLRLMAGLVAYFSLCCLLVAMIGPAWCAWFAILAAFGWMSATRMYGLGRSRTRVWRQRWEKMETQTALQTEQKLDKVVHRQRSTESIRRAVLQIVRNADDAETQRGGLGEGTRVALHKQVKVTPLPACTTECPKESFTAYVRDISASSIGLIHDRPLEQDTVLLDFELKNSISIRFVAHVLWCKRQADGRYFSGGQLTELATPISELSLESAPNQSLVPSLQKWPEHLLLQKLQFGGQHCGVVKELIAFNDSKEGERHLSTICQRCGDTVQTAREVDVPDGVVLCDGCYEQFVWTCDSCGRHIALPNIEGGEIEGDFPTLGPLHWCQLCFDEKTAQCDQCGDVRLVKDMAATEDTLYCERCAEGRGLSPTEEATVLGKGNWKEAVLDAIEELPEHLQASIGYSFKFENVVTVTLAGERFLPVVAQNESWVSEVVVTCWNSLRDQGQLREFDSIGRPSGGSEKQAEWLVLSIGGEAESLSNRSYPGHESVTSFKRKVQVAILDELWSRSGASMISKDEEGRFLRNDGTHILDWQ
jgi:hypothetical protein